MTDAMDGLKHISETHRDQFNKRREYEWKIIFTLLTFYIVSIATKYGGRVSLPTNCTFVSIVWSGFILLAIITSIFLGYIHMANNINKTIAENAEIAIGALINEIFLKQEISLFSFEEKKYWTKWKNFFTKEGGRWSWITQTITLILFSIISAYLFTK
jgi:hypothetical protein